MGPKFIQCEFCKAKFPLEKCELAACTAVINGKEHVFCCRSCAQRYEQKKKSNTH